MQEDMRLTLTLPVAREPQPKPKGVEIRLVQYRNGTPAQVERSTVVIRPDPGAVVTLYTEDWAPPTPPGVHIAREDWRRYVSRTATGVIIGAKPDLQDDEPEVFIDLPETVAAWLAVRILDALAKPHTVNTVVAAEGRRPSGMTLEAARRAIAEAGAMPPPAPLPAEFHTADVVLAASDLATALGIDTPTVSHEAIEAFRQAHIRI